MFLLCGLCSSKQVGLTKTKKKPQEFSLLHSFLRRVRMVAFIAIILAGCGSNFGSLDFDELSSPDYGVEPSALPVTFEESESVLLQKKAPVPRTELPALSRHGPMIIRGVPQSLQNFYCWYQHIPERAPPLLL
jgi:hypothetical protein